MSLHRRTFLGLAAASLALAPHTVSAKSRARVVVIGGGFGGATAARYLRRYDPSLSVTLVERDSRFVTCPFSNHVIAGFSDIAGITHGYRGLTHHGVTVIKGEAVAVDAVKKSVSLADGKRLTYDRLVLSPGIDLKWNAIAGYDEKAAERAPHAWKAGAQTLLLRRQLEAMPDGGMVVISVPGNPYRCPPGPYERASLIAHYLKTHKPRSKLLVLDAKDAFSKQALFQDAWAALYPGLIEWVPAAKDGKVVKVDAAALTVESDLGETHRAQVLNIIPPQQAGRIAHIAGLTNETGWVPVDPRRFSATKATDIHVVGDASIATPMPKSGFSANTQGKLVAAVIAAELNGLTPPEPSLANTCYSLVGPDYGISIAGVYRPGDKGLEEISGAGGVSPREASAEIRRLEARYGSSWYEAITQDSFG
jgi:sulfide dehydrogenase [flavocytochrome c] flavoprotein subunit